VRILAEAAANPPWDLPANATLDYVRAETDQPVDDLLVGASSGAFVFIQAKHTLSLGASADSEFASVLRQFITQSAPRGSTTDPWERPLEPERDRLALVVGAGSPATVRQQVPSVLGRLRSLAPGQPLHNAAVNQNEKATFQITVEQFRRIWCEIYGAEPSDEQIRGLLTLVRVQTLALDTGGSDEIAAKDLLRSVVLRDPSQADLAWTALVEEASRMGRERSGADREQLIELLERSGIGIRTPRSYWEDIGRLRSFSQSKLSLVRGLSVLTVGSAEVKIDRASTVAIRSAAEDGSLVVVGEPGAGKSGALHDLGEELNDNSRDLVFVPVDRLETESLESLRQSIGLEHDILDVLAHWSGADTAFLIIDGLDAARSERQAQTLRDLMEQVQGQHSRWRVIASIRKFDLRHGQQVRQLFVGSPPTEFSDNEFRALRHVNIPRLSDEELAQAGGQSPALSLVVSSAGEDLRGLLRIPFNLRLVGELLGEGVDASEVLPIRTQIELLERYWSHRVVRSDGRGDARELVLRRAATDMVRSRTLRARRADVVDANTSADLNDVLSHGVMVEWQATATAAPQRNVLAFSHHVLFDYAVARLLLEDDIRLVESLVQDSDLVMAIRPSLVLRFQQAWFNDPSREEFWSLAMAVGRRPEMPQAAKVIGPSVAAELAATLADIEPLVRSVESTDLNDNDSAEGVLRHLVGGIIVASEASSRRIGGADAGPWAELIDRLTA
jgi:hypothetical protein